MSFQAKKKMYGFGITLVKILIGVMMFFPIIWIVSGSFKNLVEFTTSITIIPKKITFENYRYVLVESEFFRYMKNTILLMAGTAAGTVLSSSFVAYPLARMEFPGKRLFFTLIIGTMMIPGIALIIPQYIMFGKIGWLDSLLPMIVPAFFAFPYNVFLFRQFFRSIPIELDEAATVDGCTRIGIFFRILVPLSKPIYATIIVLSSVFWWNELTQPVFYLNSEKWRTLTVALMTNYMYIKGNSFSINWTTIMAASTLMMIPPMILYLCGSKFLVEGFKTTGLKG